MFGKLQCLLTLLGCVFGSVELLGLNSSLETNVTLDVVTLIENVTSHVENTTTTSQNVKNENASLHSEHDATIEINSEKTVMPSQSRTSLLQSETASQGVTASQSVTASQGVTTSQSVTPALETVTSIKNTSDVSSHQDINSLNDGLPDAKAYVGRIFEYSLADNAIFGDQDNQIEVKEGGNTELPEWLLFDSNRRRLVGVPTQTDVGELYISVKTLCLPNSPCFKDVFLLTVLKSNYGFQNSDPQSLVFSSKSASNNEIHGCENEVVITNIVFCVSPDKLDSSSRLKLIQDMSQFLSLSETSVMLLPSSGQKLRALEDGFQIVSAGPGNAGFCEEDSNMELSWEISCSTLKHLADFVSILQHNIEVGRVQKESGVGVVGWYIASSNSVITSAHKRRRRRAGRTPIPTPVVSPVTPTKDTGSSTIVPTTSFKPEPKYTNYIPGLPTIQIAIRSSHTSSTSTKTYGIAQPTKSISMTAMTQSSTEITSSGIVTNSGVVTSSRLSEVSSQESYTPSPSGSFRPSQTTHLPSSSAFPGSSMDHTYSTSLEEALPSTRISYSESGMIESSSQPEPTNVILQTLTTTPSLFSTIEQIHTRLTSKTGGSTPPSETYRQTLTTTPNLFSTTEQFHTRRTTRTDASTPSETFRQTLTTTPSLFSTSEQIHTRPPSQTDTSSPSETFRQSSPSYEWTSEVTKDVFRSKDIRSTQGISTIATTISVSSIDDASTESSVYEGSATDSGDSSEGSASGDKIDEGSASGSGSDAIDSDDEDGLSSSLDVLSSTFTPTFSSSLMYIPQPEESGIVFEHPTDIYPVTDITESSLIFTGISPSVSPHETTEVMSTRIPSIRPLYPDEETGEKTTTSSDISTTDSGNWETIVGEDTSTFSGHGSIEDQTEKIVTTGIISEHTTSNSSQNVIIEELDTTLPTNKARSTTKRMNEFTSSTSQSPPSSTDRFWVPGEIEDKFRTTLKPDMSTTLTASSETSQRTTSAGQGPYQPPSPATPRGTTASVRENPDQQTGVASASTTTRQPDWPSKMTTIFPRGRTDWGTATQGILSKYFTTITTKRTTKWWESIAEVTTPSVFKTTEQALEKSTEFSFVTQRQNTKEKNRKKDKKGKRKKDKKKKDKKKHRKDKTTIGYWDWQTTFTVKPTSPSATKWPSLPGEPNQKPYLENSIDYIDATLGQYFEYEIPRNVFYDIEDGDTRSLELSLSLPYDQPLPPTFWLQLDSRKQMIRGLPLAVDLDTGYQNVNLIARDSGGLTETDSIKINVNSSIFGKFTHKFIMRFGVDFATFMNDRTNLNNLLRLIAGYFGDSTVKDITVLEVSVGSLLLTWSNNSLSGDECKNDTIGQLYDSMVRRDGSIRTALTRHFGKKLPIQELEYQPYGACDGMTTTVPTTTFRAETAEDKGLSIWAQVVLPVMVSLLIILLIVLLILLINRRRKKKQEPTTWDKPVFNNDRNPIIFPDELEREESKPKKAGTLNSDGSLSSGASRNSRPFYYFEDDPESNDSTLNSERSRTGSNKRPPKAPPPYWQPHSEPPPYRLPPPYAPQQTNV